MFCEKCGATLEAGTTSCPNCGEFIAAGGDVADTVAPDNKKKIIGIAAAAVVVIAAVIVLIVLLSGGAKKTLKKYLEFNYNAKGSAKSYVSNRYPDEVLEEYLDARDITKDEWIDDLEESMEEEKEELEEDGISYKFDFVSEKDLKVSELKEINEELEEYGIEAKKGIKIKVKINEYVYGDKEDSWTREYILIKIGGSWYVQ